MLQHAFKEWAVICKALAQGKQALILRKGGIDESFAVEHTRFWLFPTYTHQQRDGIQPEALPLLEEALAEKPPAGVVRLSHFAEVSGAYHVHALTPALLLAHLHLWSEETVRKRFEYRDPGIYVLPVRVSRAKEVHELPDTAHYQGCKSWVELDRALSAEGGVPILSEKEMEDLHRQLDLLLNPTTLV
jgi:hypothetical protein